MIQTVVFDTKPYDREPSPVRDARRLHRVALPGVPPGPRYGAHGARAPRPSASSSMTSWTGPAWRRWRAQGVKLLALRCTGFNNVDLAAAKELKLAVTRVPVYSPYAVAEHAVALAPHPQPQVHRAFNRVRELNFSLDGLVGLRPARQDRRRCRHGQDRAHRRPDPARVRDAGAGLRSVPESGVGQAAGRRAMSMRPLAAFSDVVSLHIPLTPETKHIIRRETLELMKPGPFSSTSAGARSLTRRP